MTQQSEVTPVEDDGDDGEPKSVAELIQQIADLSGVSVDDVNDLPTGRRCVSGAGKVWELAGTVVGREKDLLIIGLYREETEVRAYCLPLRAEDDKKQPVVPMRFAFSLEGPGVFGESMPLDTLSALMAEEISDLYEIAGTHMRTDCEVETCGASNEGDARFCKECGVRMPEDTEDPPPPPPPPVVGRPS